MADVSVARRVRGFAGDLREIALDLRDGESRVARDTVYAGASAGAVRLSHYVITSLRQNALT